MALKALPGSGRERLMRAQSPDTPSSELRELLNDADISVIFTALSNPNLSVEDCNDYALEMIEEYRNSVDNGIEQGVLIFRINFAGPFNEYASMLTSDTLKQLFTLDSEVNYAKHSVTRTGKLDWSFLKERALDEVGPVYLLQRDDLEPVHDLIEVLSEFAWSWKVADFVTRMEELHQHPSRDMILTLAQEWEPEVDLDEFIKSIELLDETVKR